MTTTERSLLCPCAGVEVILQGPRRIVRDHASCVLRAIGLDRVQCLRCGGTIGAVPASAEGHR